MKKVLSINGMSCNHCVMAVKKALLSVEGIEEVDVNLAEGKATINADEVSDKVMKEAIEDAGYEVTDIK